MPELPDGLDLTTCEREPIHIPGAIQPHGVLLAIDARDLSLLQFAGDFSKLDDVGAAKSLGLSIAALRESGGSLLAAAAETGEPEPVFLGSIEGGTGRLDVTAHRKGDVLILELEPAPERPRTAPEVLGEVRRIAAELTAALDMPRLLGAAAREVRRITGFDRVMVYQFLDDGTGSVVAEEKITSLAAFLNHRYPASDIPKQARSLYLKNLIRVIPDAGYVPAPLTPTLNPKTGEPLDMSDCSLRSVSPIHVQYLKNMGVTASMSVSIVVDGGLWGLIACHHTSPKLVPYEMRELCKHAGSILSQQVRAQEQARFHAQAQRLAGRREDLLAEIAHGGAVGASVLERLDRIAAAVPSDGAAVLFGNEVRTAGHAPGEAALRELTAWLPQAMVRETFQTNNLSALHEPAGAYARAGSGLLATLVPGIDPLWLLWFRAEQVETVEWAGNPHKPVEPGEDLGVLSPRKSFDAWKETVRNQARPWSPAEVDAACRLARGLTELRQQNTLRKLNQQLRRSLSDKESLLTQKDLLMQEANHRVQNSLQLVNSMLYLQGRQLPTPELRAHFEEASRRIMAVSSVHRRLWRSDQSQTVDFVPFIEELRNGLLDTWGAEWRDQIGVEGHQVLVPTDKAVVLALVVTELLTNAVKYAYEGGVGPIDIRVALEGRSLRLAVRDRGGGMRQAPTSGLGSRLTRSLVEQLGGELQVENARPGTEITLNVPLLAPAWAG